MKDQTLKNIKTQVGKSIIIDLKNGYTYVGTLADIDEKGIVLYNPKYGTSIIALDEIKMMRIKAVDANE